MSKCDDPQLIEDNYHPSLTFEWNLRRNKFVSIVADLKSIILNTQLC